MALHKIKPNVWVMDDLGFIFFHNGNGLLKLNKAWYMSSFSDPDRSEELLREFSDFFDPATGTEGPDSYEQCKIKFTVRPAR